MPLKTITYTMRAHNEIGSPLRKIIIGIILSGTPGANTVTEFGIGIFLQIAFKPIPAALAITNFISECKWTIIRLVF